MYGQLLDTSVRQVLSGPFSGMKYLEYSVGSTLPPKILGTYELELHTLVERLITLRPSTIFNIGAAEGYYAIGFARRLPETKVLCWEISEVGRHLTSLLLDANAVSPDRVSIAGICTLSELRNALELAEALEQSLILVDIEGGEALLLDPEILPRLKSCQILVEIHEFAVPGVEKLLVNRFIHTHHIEHIQAYPRRISDWPKSAASLIAPGFEGAAIALMNEGRPPNMSWLYLNPISMKGHVN